MNGSKRAAVGKTTKIFEMVVLETPEIARRLGIAEGTAPNIRALLRAMGAHSRLEAVLIGLRAGVISANSSTADDNRSQPQ